MMEIDETWLARQPRLFRNGVGCAEGGTGVGPALARGIMFPRFDGGTGRCRLDPCALRQRRGADAARVVAELAVRVAWRAFAD